MSSGIQTANGKAFEYACVLILYRELAEIQNVEIVNSPQLDTAKRLYTDSKSEMKDSLISAAYAAIRVIRRLEPQLWNFEENDILYLSIQSDAAGISGDVRDVICLRKQNGWQIGFSCKHNHHAVKHSRLSDTIDFGKEWLGIPCSEQYFSKIVPLFSRLRILKDESKANGRPMLWDEIENKAETYYRPVLQAFIDELRRIGNEYENNVPQALIRYLIGRYDFYKIITDDTNRTTRVEAINIAGTLNAAAGAEKAITKVPLLRLPTQFYHIDFKQDSDNTIEVVCDEGWQISMRIHSASSKVEPSLKFDVQLISFPSTVYTQTEPWEIANKGLTKRLSAYKEKTNTECF